ncbi:helix-turn-helix domain-containing protein [Euzebya tangerina]|uniref:helix-turn-helix domain-containing protein n=1 Tax=Euzebya tangerina TaxID=591198 RepID=UPI000E319D84|nr:helix-turn-helix domain-containing protein [Euzebya tangerina]
MHTDADSVALVAALEARIPVIAERTIVLLTTEIEAYADLSAERASDVMAVIEGNLLVWCRAARLGRLPVDAELRPFLDGARRRARQGIGIDALLSAYGRGAAVAWETLASLVDPADPASLGAALEVSGWIVRYTDRVSTEVARAHAEELDRLAGHDPTAVQRLLDRGASDSSAWWAIVGRPEAVRAHRAAGTVVIHHVDHGLSLDPYVAALLQLDPIPRADATIGVSGPSSGPLRPALVDAATAASLADRHGRVGQVTLDDVLFEGVIEGAAGAVVQRLAMIGRTISEHDRLHRTQLTDTVTALVAADGSRRLAAGALEVHRNTLGQRLDRLAQITTHDPAGPRGLTVLAAALSLLTSPPSGSGEP